MKIVGKIIVQVLSLVSVLLADTSCYEKYCSKSITAWYNSEDTTFHLINGCQLAGLAKLVNEGVDDFSGKKIYLDYDVDMRYSPYVGAADDGQFRTCSWTPIGNQWAYRFRGEFDGQNKEISGLNIDAVDRFRGFFGLTENAVVKRIRFGKKCENFSTGPVISDARYTTISNVYSEMDIDCVTDFYDGGSCGGIVRYGAPANLYNDTVKANIRGNTAGGIVGALYEGYDGKHSVVKIENCYFEGNVEGTESAGGLAGGLNGKKAKITKSAAKGRVIAYGGSIGGIVASMRTGQIERSNYMGDVIGNVDDDDVICTIGGIVGEGGGEIIYSNSKGNVIGNCFYAGGLVGSMGSGDSNSIKGSYHIGKVLGRGFVGGIAGKASGRIYNSYAEGDVIIDSAYRSYDGGAGGIAGFADSVIRSYHKGDVIGSAYYIGGLVGYARMVVDSSYHLGGNVMGVAYVGGLVGKIDYGVISNSYSITDSIIADSIVGGLVGSVGDQGYLYNGSYTNYSSAKVVKSFSSGNVYGCSKVGGLVGLLNVEGDSLIQSYSINNVYGLCHNSEKSNLYIGGLVGYGLGVIQESYASGSIDVNYDISKDVGCIIGFVNDSLKLTNVYYDSLNCKWSIINGDPNIVSIENSSGKSTDEMFSKYSFENWDFVNTWFINENKSYPYLMNDDVFNAFISTEDLGNLVYNNGRSIEPKVLSVVLSNDTLVANKDYKVSYENNNKIGKGLIKVCGNGNYKGCRNISFDIKPIPITPYLPDIENQIYTGDSIKPIKKVYNESTLISDQYYFIEYANNLNAGTASVTVTMKGNYVGSATATFTIEKATPIISQNPKASDILIGETLALSSLSGGISNVDGSFAWETPETIPTLENDGYAVEFIPTDANNYNSVEVVVPIKVWDVAYVAVHLGNTTLDSMVVIKGKTYTLPTVYDSVGYNFVGFYKGKSKFGNSGDKIVVNENTVIEAVYEIKTFVVKFVNGDTELQSEELAYGSLPEYKGENPLKTPTVQWTYSFKSWNPSISSVVGSATYTAEFDSVVNKYELIFMDYDGSILKDVVQYDYGTSSISIVKPTSPTRQETAKYTYSFKGWDPSLIDVTENAVYIAEYDSTVRSYTIAFVNGSKEMQSSKVAYGEMPIYAGKIPTKTASKSYSYEFIGWLPKLAPVEKDVKYVAIFDSVAITGIADAHVVNLEKSVCVVSRNIQISAAPVGTAYAILDLQGRVLKKGRVEFANFNVTMLQAGNYMVRIGNHIQRVSIK